MLNFFTPHICRCRAPFHGLLWLPGRAVSLGFVLKFTFIWHLQCNTQIPWNKNWQTVKTAAVCNSAYKGQQAKRCCSHESAMTDFYTNSAGHKFSANSERAFKPKQLLVAQIIFNNSSLFWTLFMLRISLNTSDLHLPTIINYKAFLLQLASSWKQN